MIDSQDDIHAPDPMFDDVVDDFDLPDMEEGYAAMFEEEEKWRQSERWRAIGFALRQWGRHHNHLPDANFYPFLHWATRIWYTLKAVLCCLGDRFGNTQDDKARVLDDGYRRFGFDCVACWDPYVTSTEDGTDHRTTVLSVGGGVFRGWAIAIDEEGSL